MVAENTKFATRVEQRWRATRARSNGVRQSGEPSPIMIPALPWRKSGRRAESDYDSGSSVPCFSFFQTLSNPARDIGRCLRSGSICLRL
ncbi:hypothetical protein ES705_20374 [subsurface metagenome]